MLRNATNSDFEPKIDYSTVAYPLYISSGDLNGDGYVDLVVNNNGSSSLSILLQNSNHTGFTQSLINTTGLSNSFIGIGDFNGDGKTDLAVAKYTNDTVSVLLNNPTQFASVIITDPHINTPPHLPAVTPSLINGTLTSSDAINPFSAGNYYKAYTPIGFIDGRPLTIALASTDFDTYLQVIRNGSVLVFNDDSNDTSNSLLNYTYQTGDSIYITSFGGLLTGAYSLNLSGAAIPPVKTLTAPEDTAITLTNTMLPITDLEQTAAQLTYTLESIANHAIISKSGITLNTNDTFTQADVDNGLISVTPNTNFNGTDTFTFNVADGFGGVLANQTFTINVTPVNDAPTLTTFSAPVASGFEDTATPIAISFTDLKAQGNEADIDSAVTAFVIKAVSTGTLKIGTSVATASVWNANSNHTVDASHQAYWTPKANANGSLNAFTAIAKDNGGLTSATAIQAKVAVTAVNDAPTGSVSITGTPKQGQILTASHTLADVDGLGVIAYQWQAGGNNITGATKAAYTLTQTDVGKAITVKAVYTDGGGKPESITANATVLIESNQNPGVSFTNINKLFTTEAAGTAAFGVALKVAPRHDVKLTLTLNDSTEGQFAVNQKSVVDLTFTAANWNKVQAVSLQGVDDKLEDGDISYIVSTKVSSEDLRYDGMRSGTGLSTPNIVAINADDDAPDEQYGDEGGKAVIDFLQGGNGASDLYGLLGRDELHGGNADDRLYGGYGDDTLYGEADNDELEGEQGNDKLYGGDGNDTLTGGTGNDKLVGGNGNDSLDGSSGAETMDGGNGADTYYVDNALDVVSDSGTDVGVDTVNIASYISSTFKYVLGAGIENALLTEDAKDADLTGNLSNNSLSGNSFDNLMGGGAGTDTLNGGAGNDNLAGGLGNDKLLGGVGADSLAGGDGADQLNGGTGNDNINGGNGIDTALFGADNSTINLTTGKATGSTEGTDTLSGIEIVDAGAGNDTVTGSASADTMLGGLGNDNLSGGAGKDTLTGGLGKDTFDFNVYSEMGLGAIRDVITDFTRGQDKIDLSTIDPNSALAGNQAFKFTTTTFNTAGQIHYSNGIISLNTDSDAATEYEIQLTGVIPTTLAATDFVL